MRLSGLRGLFAIVGRAGRNSGALRSTKEGTCHKAEIIGQEGKYFLNQSPSCGLSRGRNWSCSTFSTSLVLSSDKSPSDKFNKNSFQSSDLHLSEKHVNISSSKKYFSGGPSSFPTKDLEINSSGTEGLQLNSGLSGFWQHKHRLGEEDGGDASLMTAFPSQSSSLSPSSSKDKVTLNTDRSNQWQRSRGEEQRFRNVNFNNGASLSPVPSTSSEVQREYYIPVQAYYIARSLDFKGLLDGPFKGYLSHVVRNNVVFRFPDRTNGPAPGASGMGAVPFLSERYMVAFQYGSVVFLNFEAREQEKALEDIMPFCSDHFTEARKDDYGIVLRPSLAGWSEGGQDHIMVKQLDISNIRVITSVLGQSVALEFYAKKVDEMVTTFSDLNRGMEKTGTFTMKRKKLFQLVAAANTTLADVILKLGLLERSDTAWKHAHYAKIWEYLRDDFELDERFESLDFKLNIIQHNVRFFLDILQNRKSDTLEWIIILLIAGEICVSLYEIISTAMKTSQANLPTPVPAIDSVALGSSSSDA